VRVAAHRPHVVLVEAHGLAAGGKQHHVVRCRRCSATPISDRRR
jgi:hypothetical protein